MYAVKQNKEQMYAEKQNKEQNVSCKAKRGTECML
jgi:hypothetical protein